MQGEDLRLLLTRQPGEPMQSLSWPGSPATRVLSSRCLQGVQCDRPLGTPTVGEFWLLCGVSQVSHLCGGYTMHVLCAALCTASNTCETHMLPPPPRRMRTGGSQTAGKTGERSGQEVE